MRFTREQINKTLQNKIAHKEPIIIGGAGLGIIAKCADRAGIDLIMAYNTGPFRMDGLLSFVGYMPYGDCNDITLTLGDQILGRVEKTPVIAGVGVADPYRKFKRNVQRMLEKGFSGITNVPTVGGAWSGEFRRDLEANGMGYAQEVKMIGYCAKNDIFTVAYCFDKEQIRAMAGAGADIVSPHVGGTAGGSIGFVGFGDMDRAVEKIQTMYEAAVSENPNVMVVAHGGPLNTSEAVSICLERTKVHGFIGASAFERIPVEESIVETVRRFKALSIR